MSLISFNPFFRLFGKVQSSNHKIAKGKITLAIPKRPKGQKDVLKLACNPVPTVRIAIVGVGTRGIAVIKRMLCIPNTEIVALCDLYEKNTLEGNLVLEQAKKHKASVFYGETAWQKITKLPDVDLVYVATEWKLHARIGIQAMKDGKHVAIEVPAALTIQEIWDLVNTAEQTRRHCIQLENCVYDSFELTTLNMVQQGLLGEIIHCQGAYIHQLQPFWSKWRTEYNHLHRGDLYPTHSLGPACQILNIHRGDRLEYLVSMDTKAVGNLCHYQKSTNKAIKDFKNGDHTMTMISTANRKSILIEHNVVSPRPYNRMYQVTGTKGFANKYPIEGYSFDKQTFGEIVCDNRKSEWDKDTFITDADKDMLIEKYTHPIVYHTDKCTKDTDNPKDLNYIMDFRLIYCLHNGLPLDMDVYDLAEWCCAIPLSEISLENNSIPVAIPDFTRGYWNKLNKLNFAIQK